MADAQATPDYARIKRNISKMISLGAPEADIDAYVASESVTPEQLRGAPAAAPNEFGDMAAATGAGLVRGAAETAMAPVTMKRTGEGLIGSAMDYAENAGRRLFGYEPISDKERADRQAKLDAADPIGGFLYPKQDQARAVMDANLYEAKTTPGKYAQTVAEFLPGAVIGGAPGIAGKAENALRYAVAPGVASEMAGQAAEGSGYEGFARGTAAVLAGTGASMLRMPEAIKEALPGGSRDALSSVSPVARDYVTKNLSPAKVAAMKAERDRLGPEGMLADVSPEWMGVARGAAAQPDMRDEIVNALLERNAGKNARMNSTINSELGPAKSPLTLESEIKTAKEAISPEYTAVLKGAKAVDTSDLALKLEAAAVNERGAGANAAAEVRDMLNIRGTKELDPNPETLLNTRKAIDGMLKKEQDGNVIRILKDARRSIDSELADKVPGIKAVDAKWADVERQDQAYEAGKGVFRGGENPMWPDELAAKKAELVQPAGSVTGVATRSGLDRLTEGTRAKLEEIVGTNANDTAALNRALKGEGDWNRDKLRMIFGDAKADKILSVLDAETKMAQTGYRVTAGSDTAMANRFGSFLDDMGKGKALDTGTTATGLGLRLGQKVLNSLVSDLGEQRAAQVAKDLGRMSIAKGADLDAIIQALMTRAANPKTPRLKSGAEAVVRALVNAGNSGAVPQP